MQLFNIHTEILYCQMCSFLNIDNGIMNNEIKDNIPARTSHGLTRSSFATTRNRVANDIHVCVLRKILSVYILMSFDFPFNWKEYFTKSPRVFQTATVRNLLTRQQSSKYYYQVCESSTSNSISCLKFHIEKKCWGIINLDNRYSIKPGTLLLLLLLPFIGHRQLVDYSATFWVCALKLEHT